LEHPLAEAGLSREDRAGVERGLVLNNLFTLVQTLLNYVLGLVGGVLPLNI
jgi:hypothetical protein